MTFDLLQAISRALGGFQEKTPPINYSLDTKTKPHLTEQPGKAFRRDQATAGLNKAREGTEIFTKHVAHVLAHQGVVEELVQRYRTGRPREETRCHRPASPSNRHHGGCSGPVIERLTAFAKCTTG